MMMAVKMTVIDGIRYRPEDAASMAQTPPEPEQPKTPAPVAHDAKPATSSGRRTRKR